MRICSFWLRATRCRPVSWSGSPSPSTGKDEVSARRAAVKTRTKGVAIDRFLSKDSRSKGCRRLRPIPPPANSRHVPCDGVLHGVPGFLTPPVEGASPPRRTIIPSQPRSGKRVEVGFGQDPGQAGESQAQHLVRAHSPGQPYRAAIARRPEIRQYPPTRANVARVRCSLDSPLERRGFELPVPLVKRVGLSGGTGSCCRGEKGCFESAVYSPGDRGFESLYPSKPLLAGRHCRLAEPGRPSGSSPRILCFEHLEGTCARQVGRDGSPVGGCASSASTGD
jgi:hypothetical protein